MANVISITKNPAERFLRLFTVGPQGSLCCWGAITCESADPVATAQRVEALGLPVIVCRTGTGGTQVYLFLEKWTPKEMASGALIELAGKIGLPPEIEVSPSARGRSPVVWMPYFRGERAVNYALHGDGSPMAETAFLDRAEQLAQTTHIADVLEIGPTGATRKDIARYVALFGGPQTNNVARRTL